MTTLLLLKIIDVLDVFNFAARVPAYKARFGLTYVSLLVKQCTTLDTERRWISMSSRLMIFTPRAVNNAYLLLFSLPLHLKFVGTGSKPGALKSYNLS